MGLPSLASLIRDSPQSKAKRMESKRLIMSSSAQQKAYYEQNIKEKNVMVKEAVEAAQMYIKEKNIKREKQYQKKKLARRKRDEQVIAKYKASRACHTHTTKKAKKMFNQWKKEFHLAQLKAKADAIMRSYATKGCEAEQDLLVEYLGKANMLRHQKLCPLKSFDPDEVLEQVVGEPLKSFAHGEEL